MLPVGARSLSTRFKPASKHMMKLNRELKLREHTCVLSVRLATRFVEIAVVFALQQILQLSTDARRISHLFPPIAQCRHADWQKFAQRSCMHEGRSNLIGHRYADLQALCSDP